MPDKDRIRKLAEGIGSTSDAVKNAVREFIRRRTDRDALFAEEYSSKDYSFDEAYKDARSKGQKTFYWDGKYYNTDYEGAHGRKYATGGPFGDDDRYAVRSTTSVAHRIPDGLGYVPGAERPLLDRSSVRFDDGIMGFVPFVGDGLQLAQSIDDFRNHDWVTGLQTAGLVLVPNVIEKFLRPGLRIATHGYEVPGRFISNEQRGLLRNLHGVNAELLENSVSEAVAANQRASGGGIHIKPSHRGRLTALKERTGKSEAELYNDGNPAHKRMVVFARNARKWKHADGGPIKPVVVRPEYRNAMTDKGEYYYDIVRARYDSAMGALQRKGFSYEDASRLAPLIVTQNILEGGWNLSRKDNNFGGMRANGRTLSFDSPDAFYDSYIDMLDEKWGNGRAPRNNWRNAWDLDDWARILNREDLRLRTKDLFDEYNREHRDNPVYLYAPEWENNDRSYRSHLAGVEDRTNYYLDLINDEAPYANWDEPVYDEPETPYYGGGMGGGERAAGGLMRKINRYDGNTEPTQQMDRVPNWKVRGSDYSMWSPGAIQDIINWGATNPYSFFGEEGKDTRESLNRAGLGESVIGGIYDLLPKHQQWLYGYEYMPEKEKEQLYTQGIRDYRDTKGLGFTLGALSIPLAAMGVSEALGPGASWLVSNPKIAMGAGKFVAPLLGAGALDNAFQRYTPWRSWGHAVNDTAGVYDNPFYQYALGDYGKGFVDAAAEFTNPMFLFPYEGAAKGIAGALNRAESRAAARAAMKPGGSPEGGAPEIVQMLDREPMEAYAVDLSSPSEKTRVNPETGEIISAPDSAPSGYGVAVNPETGEIVPRRNVAVNPETGEVIAAPETTRPSRPNPGMTDAEFNEWLENASNEQIYGFRLDMRDGSTVYPPSWDDLASAELIIRFDGLPFDAPGVGGAETGAIRPVPETASPAAPAPRTTAHASRGGSPFSGIRDMSDDELRNLARRVESGQVGFEGAPIDAEDFAAIVRSRGNDRLVGGGRARDYSGVTDEQLEAAIRESGYDWELFDMVNYGYDRSDPEWFSPVDYKSYLREEADRRITARANSGYATLEEAARDLSRARSYETKRDVRLAASSVIRREIIAGNDIPKEFENDADSLIYDLINSGDLTDRNNKHFKQFYSRLEDAISQQSIQEVSHDLFGAKFSHAGDNSRIAATLLRRKFPGKSDKQIKEILQRVTPKMIGGGEPVPEELRDVVDIVRQAYAKPSINTLRTSYGVRLLEDEARETVLKRMLSDKGIDPFDINVLMDPSHPDYVKVASELRKAGISILPGDITLMSMNELVGPKKKLASGEYDTAIEDMLTGRDAVDEGVESAFRDDFERLAKQKYGSDMNLSLLKRRLADRSRYKSEMDRIWREIREDYAFGGEAMDAKKAELMSRDSFDDDVFFEFRKDFEKRLLDKYGTEKRTDVEEMLSDYTAYYQELSKLWQEVKGEYYGITGLKEHDKYVRLHAEKLMQKDIAKAKQEAGLREQLLELAMPRQTQIADHSTSVQSYSLQISGAGKGDYGTGPYQSTVLPLHPEYARLDPGYAHGNDYHENRVQYDIDGTIVNYGQADPRAEFGDLFRREQVESFLNSTESMNDTEWFDYVMGNPGAKELVEKMLYMIRRLHEIDVEFASRRIAKANRVNVGMFGQSGYIAPPPMKAEYPFTIEEYASSPGKLRGLIKRIHSSMDPNGGSAFAGPGFSMRMDRTPVGALRHKYGGLIERMGSVYGNDRNKIMSALRTARIVRKK